MTGVEQIVRDHPFFGGMEAAACDFIAGCARNVRFDAGDYLFREGEAADQFYLLREGLVALEIAAPGRPPTRFLTLHAGEMVGVSWLVPPYRWSYDAIATERTRAIALDAACLRDKCETDPRLGYEMMKRFMPILTERLRVARLQGMDLYGSAR